MNKEDEDKNKAIFDYYKDWDVISRSIKDFQTYQVGKEYVTIELILERDKPTSNVTKEELEALLAPIKEGKTKTQRRDYANHYIRNNMKYVNNREDLAKVITQAEEKYNVKVTYKKNKQYIKVL